MKFRLLLLPILLGAVSTPFAYSAESPLVAFENEGDATTAKQDVLYSEGTRAINDSRWPEAVAIFTKIAQQHGSRAEAAAYWKAYAQNKEGKPAQALESCAELRQAHPHGQWIDECGALEIEIHGKSGNPMPPQADQDEDLKLLALNSLMQQDESCALPAIEQILNGNRSEHLKDRALFVLAQDQSPQAQNLLGQIARGQSNPSLQRKAIQMFAITRGKQSAAVLADVYRQSSNDEVKKAVLQAYLITGNPDPLVAAAGSESSPELARAAVQNLGALGATSQLLTLYHGSSSPETKRAIINALTASGQKGAEALGNIASSEQDPELRRKAISNLGIAGGMSAAPSLLATYRKNTDSETKKAVLTALFLAGDTHDLIDLARTEKDPALKQAIVQQLSLMHSKDATDYMLEVLNK